uniref:Uncharacterized protein n=1 Tax=Oryza glumipatula TaxID=40148 RepID=A0A0E0AIH1_9ORYZ
MGSAATADPAASASRPQQETAAGEQGRRWGAGEQERQHCACPALARMRNPHPQPRCVGRWLTPAHLHRRRSSHESNSKEMENHQNRRDRRMGNFRARHLIHCSGEQPNSERCFAHRTSSRGPPEGWGGRKVGERRGGGVSGVWRAPDLTLPSPPPT